MAELMDAAAARRPGGVPERLGHERLEPSFAIRRLPLVLATVWSAAGLVLGAVALGAELAGRAVADFTREPVEALQETTCAGAECAYIGALSNAGLLIWGGTAGVCLLVAAVVRAREADRGLAAPFLWFGLMTTVLALDDAFQIHEFVAPALTGRGEALAVGAYALLLALLVVRHRSFVVRTSFGLLLVSGALFVLSAALDRWLPGLHLLEDGAKFVGIATWATWLTGTAVAVLAGERRTV